MVYKILFLLFGLCFTFNSQAQSMTCQEVFEIVTEDYDYRDDVSCLGSRMLVKVTYYQVNNMGFVVAYIKNSDYDYNGSPYIFCGISLYKWSSFTSGYLSWGESFHKHLRKNICDCS